jgi:hypothetical protein
MPVVYRKRYNQNFRLLGRFAPVALNTGRCPVTPNFPCPKYRSKSIAARRPLLGVYLADADHAVQQTIAGVTLTKLSEVARDGCVSL